MSFKTHCTNPTMGFSLNDDRNKHFFGYLYALTKLPSMALIQQT